MRNVSDPRKSNQSSSATTRWPRRATYLCKGPGDVSSLENPAAVKAVAEAA
jgi:hypothetical protein